MPLKLQRALISFRKIYRDEVDALISRYLMMAYSETETLSVMSASYALKFQQARIATQNERETGRWKRIRKCHHGERVVLGTCAAIERGFDDQSAIGAPNFLRDVCQQVFFFSLRCSITQEGKVLATEKLGSVDIG